ncbi:Piso0_000241 [Millerozyma farinosa CBS 7064]|uniref:Piso0_000241 protein n=1 Tax=Pichia sorbitophila (strain ATCC MYA-4447 / BCRC 22081 / CBS 7064 / NBRC 10061 / NRRL Y-12695) TaxID=559304 RepID=G8YUW8_PICSO|nr:Piso0_000241 [Millerozyma farinosa CBS 7064]
MFSPVSGNDCPSISTLKGFSESSRPLPEAVIISSLFISAIPRSSSLSHLQFISYPSSFDLCPPSGAAWFDSLDASIFISRSLCTRIWDSFAHLAPSSHRFGPPLGVRVCPHRKMASSLSASPRVPQL